MDTCTDREKYLRYRARSRQWVGKHVVWKESTGSTNDDCQALAKAGESGVAVLADVQTHGRGQHGRHWRSPPGLGLLVSLSIPDPKRSSAFLIAWSSLSVAEVLLEHAGLTPRIKWPNDVLVAGKKMAGVLVERQESTVVGIGINVLQSQHDFPPDCPVPPTSVLLESGTSIDRVLLADHLLSALDFHWPRCEDELFERWAAFLPMAAGQLVSATTRTGTEIGWFQSLRPDTGLTLIGKDSNQQHVIPSEHLVHLTPLAGN